MYYSIIPSPQSSLFMEYFNTHNIYVHKVQNQKMIAQAFCLFVFIKEQNFGFSPLNKAQCLSLT